MPRVDGVVGVSESTLAQVVDFYGLGVPSTCIPNAIDPGALIAARSREAVRSGAGVPIEGRVLLFVGSLTEEKRVDRLLRLMRRVCEAVPDAHLWLVGDGPLRGELERHAEELSVTPCVHFLGTQANVATFMKAADLFLLTSDSEGMPAVILEAGLLGLPVVATRVGGLPESVLDGKTGVLVDPQDEEGLFCAVLRLLQNLQDATALGSSATAWVRANFTMDVIAQRYVTFYNTVLGHS